MRVARFLSAAMLLVVVTALPLRAQDEAHLRKALEGKRITLKMDMPATAEGVDVHPGTSRPVDYDKVGKRMKKEGIAIRDGESARITKIKVKRDLIEVQLNGGGYGTFGDGLGHLLKNQAADSGMAQQLKYQNQRNEKLAGGSRFNLRYPTGVQPENATPASVIQALEEYASFPTELVANVRQASYSSSAASSSPATAASQPGQVRKGMSAQEIAAVSGAPVSIKTNGPITTHRYRGAGGMFDVDFVNDVAVDVRQLASSTNGSIRKGMSLEELEQVAGKPSSSTLKNQILTNKYDWQDGILEADFYNGVLVGYRTSSK
jgi:hypothetical protein